MVVAQAEMIEVGGGRRLCPFDYSSGRFRRVDSRVIARNTDAKAHPARLGRRRDGVVVTSRLGSTTSRLGSTLGLMDTEGKIETAGEPDATRSLGSLTTNELSGEPATTLIVPLGATEQHGPHLPLDTDTAIATAWANRVAARLGDSVVAPALPYGSSGEHQSFAGTLSIGREALRTVIIELTRSAAIHHQRVVFVSGHAGNAEPLREAVSQLIDEGHHVSLLLPLIEGADAHAGRTETSIMLAIEPDHVRTDHLEVGCMSPLSSIIDQLRLGGVAAVAPNGVLGDPTLATVAEGVELLVRLDKAPVEGSPLTRRQNTTAKFGPA